MMNYEEALEYAYTHGVAREDRTGVGTRSVTGLQIRYDLSEGFPLITSKRVDFEKVAGELLWFLRGETNVKSLNSKIWDAWADEKGDLGRIYGAQWREWASRDCMGEWNEPDDQIHAVQVSLYTNPFSRRHLVSAWNVAELDYMALPPCHYAFQFVVHPGNDGVNRLDIVVSQRSADMFLGVPYNLASYALLCHLMADVVGMVPGELVWNGADCHIYDNHREQVGEQLENYRARNFALPSLEILRSHRNVWDYTLDDFKVVGYESHGAIRGEVAV